MIFDCDGKTQVTTCQTSNPLELWRSSTGPWPSEHEDINIVVASIVQFIRMMKSITGGTWTSFRDATNIHSDIQVHIRLDMKDGHGVFYEHETNSIYLDAVRMNQEIYILQQHIQ